MSRCRPMPRDACAGTVCLPRSKRCRIPGKEKKREASIDLNCGDASRPGHFRQARDYSARDVVEALRTFGVYTEGGDGLPGVSSDPNARIDFNFTKHGHAVGHRGFRASTVAKDVQRLASA